MSVSEAILHFAGHAREAAVWGKLGTSWDRFRLRPELPSPAVPLCANALTSCSGLPPGHPATLPFLRAATPGPGRSPTFREAMVLLALRGVLVGFLIGRRERPKALMASLLWFSTFHRREDVQRSHRAFVRCGELGHPRRGWRGLSGSTPARCWPSAPPPSSRRRWLTASRASCGCCLGLRRRCCSRDGLQHSV